MASRVTPNRHNLIQDTKLISGKKIMFGDAGEHMVGDGTDLKMASSNDLVIDVANNIKLDFGNGNMGEGLQFALNGTILGDINSHHATTFLTIYENGGASDDDYFRIECAAAGATKLLTTDQASNNAHLHLEADGDVAIKCTPGGTIKVLENDDTIFVPSDDADIATKKYVDDFPIYYWNLNAGFNYSSTAGTKVYAPLNGYIIESSGSLSRNEYQVIVMPHDGYLSKVVVRSEQVCGETVVGLHIASDGTEPPSATASHSTTVDMSVDDTAYHFAFGTGATVSSGQAIAISFDPTNDANDTILTVVFILDGST